MPFVKYSLEIILSAYKDFSSRVEHLQNKPLSKAERIKILFDNTLKNLSKKDIKEQCPDISISTIEIVLHNLLQEEYVIKVGASKNTSYVRNTEKWQNHYLNAIWLMRIFLHLNVVHATGLLSKIIKNNIKKDTEYRN